MFVENSNVDVVLRGVILTAVAITWVVVLVRLNGLRSFSKMTNFDFVMTVAIGSLLAGASQATNWHGFLQAVIGMASLFLVQRIVAQMRKSSDRLESLIQNEPIILMRDGEIIHKALSETRVAQSDLIAKLREANVLDFSEVRAVVLETTGDISVLHGEECADDLLTGARKID